MAKYYNESVKEAVARYQKTHIQQVKFNFSIERDADILARLETVGNKQGYIKDLIRADIARNLAEDPKKEENKMKWFVVDERGGDIFDEMTSAKTRDEAVRIARAEWSAISAHDQKLRRDFYAALAEPDEDGHIDFNTCTETVSIMKEEDKLPADADAEE